MKPEMFLKPCSATGSSSFRMYVKGVLSNSLSQHRRDSSVTTFGPRRGRMTVRLKFFFAYGYKGYNSALRCSAAERTGATTAGFALELSSASGPPKAVLGSSVRGFVLVFFSAVPKPPLGVFLMGEDAVPLPLALWLLLLLLLEGLVLDGSVEYTGYGITTGSLLS